MSFRTSYVTHEEMERTMRAWATHHPEVVQLTSIGTTVQGRELLLLVIGRDRERVRPAAWVDGNMHATELVRIERRPRDRRGRHLAPHGKKTLHNLPEHVCDRLREMLFYVLPRMCPDGAEAVLKEGRYVRSNPRDRRAHAPVPRWIISDVDGDGLALLMRQRIPLGDYVEAPDLPGDPLAPHARRRWPLLQGVPRGSHPALRRADDPQSALPVG